MHMSSGGSGWWRRRRDRTAGAEPPAALQTRVIRWGAGHAPGSVIVKAQLPVRLVFERLDGAGDSEFVAIPGLGWVTTLGGSARCAVDLGPCPVGTYAITSVDGLLQASLIVEP